MAITVTHQKVSAISDGGDAGLVLPSDWNASHTLSGTVPVANGGTDAATAAAACKNLRTWNILAASAVAVSHTGDTNETTLATIAVPAGAMGANGVLRITTQVGKTGTAGNLTIAVKFGGTTYASGSVASTVLSHHGEVGVANRNATNSQVAVNSSSTAWNTSGGWGQVASAVVTSAEDTTAAVNITITATLGNSADTVRLEAYMVEILAQA